MPKILFVDTFKMSKRVNRGHRSKKDRLYNDKNRTKGSVIQVLSIHGVSDINEDKKTM